MRILNRLTDLSDAQLKQLESNAQGNLVGSRAVEAELVIKAVAEERGRRAQMAAVNSLVQRKGLQERMKGLSFADRVRIAFTELPPVDWEVRAIQALAANPGSTTEELSANLGYSGTYMNWFGHVCRDREAWLGTPFPGDDGKVVHSSLLVEFGKRMLEGGREASTWTLKEVAREGLVRAGVIASPPAP